MLRCAVLLQYSGGGAFRNPSKSQWLLLSSSSYSVSRGKKPELAPLQERRMIDKLTLYAKGGVGGKGCSSYHRTRRDRYGKPDGGDGGVGGDVFLDCCPSVWDFSGLQHHVNGGKGGNGTSRDIIGRRGADKFVKVPVGTVIHLVKGEVPCFVEGRFSKELYPWEIRSTLADDSYQSDLQPGCTSPTTVDENTGGLSPHMETTEEKSANVKTPTQVSSIEYFPHSSSSHKKAERCREDSSVYVEDSACKGFDTDDSTSEAKREEEEEIQYNVAELTEEGQRIIVACGGKGGAGNARRLSDNLKVKRGERVKKDSVVEVFDIENKFAFTNGLPGSESVLVLELKSIADVGLVGFPNAGKSTLLGAISRARPAVGNYAFTTLRPSIGKLNYDDYFTATVADIPGLIRGAHENRGLGHSFLRHIERTKALVFVLDLAAALDGHKGLPPWEQLKDLVFELECYRKGLSKQPSLVVANKIDEAGTEGVLEELKRRVQCVPIFPVCAVLEEGVPELKAGLRKLVDGEESYRVDLDGISTD